VYGIKWKCEEPFQVQDMNEPKVAQMYKVLYKRFRVTHSEGKPNFEPVIIKTVQWFGDKMNVTDSCTFLEGWLQNLKHQQLQDTYKWKTPLLSSAAQYRSSKKKLLLRKLVQHRYCLIHGCQIKWILLHNNQKFCVCVGEHPAVTQFRITHLPTSDSNPCYSIQKGHFSGHCSVVTVAKLNIQNKQHCKWCCRFPNKLCKLYCGWVSTFN